MTSAEIKTPVTAENPWESMAHKYNILHVRLQLILEEVAAAFPTSVFEIGCSMGVLRRELLRRLPGLVYHACDVSQSAVDAINDPNVVRADLNHDPLPFANRKFDCIVGSGVFEYVADVPGLLTKLRGMLNPGGRLVVSYFNMKHLYRRWQRFRGWPPFRNPTWLNDYSLDEFRNLLRKTGFRVFSQIPYSVGLKNSPSIGEERFSAAAVRRMRHLPFIKHFTHQMVYAADLPR